MPRRALRWYARHSPVKKGTLRLVRAARSLAPGSRVISEVVPGTWMELDLRSYIDRRIYYEGFYRVWATAYFEALLGPASIVVDVGANVGPFTLLAARRVGPRGLVTAFEPAEDLRARLQRNVRLNRLDNVRCEGSALSDRDGMDRLHRNAEGADNRGQGSLARQSGHTTFQTVPVSTLDRYLERHPEAAPDVLKIDTQGAELRVLKGARACIRRRRPAVFVRCHEEKCLAFGDSSADVQAFLLDAGYALYRADPTGDWTGVTAPTPCDDATFVAVVA